MLAEPVIKVKNVWKSFKAVQAVKGIDLCISKGQFVALLGPNGAGKTTLVDGRETKTNFTGSLDFLYRKPGLLINSGFRKHYCFLPDFLTSGKNVLMRLLIS
jgi:ABC-type multidrug transport system ATPase subunit